MDEKIKIGISACLLGHNVRWDEENKQDRFITDTLGRYLEFVPVCPENECSLGTPRPALQLVGNPENPRLMNRKEKIDYTGQMMAWSKTKLPELERQDLCGFIFKSKSPSCGMERIPVYQESGPAIKQGIGIFARQFMEAFPQIPAEDDGRLHDPKLRENFIETLFTLKRWRNVLAQKKQMKNLIDFHTRNKLLILSHNQKIYRQMGKLVGNGGTMPTEDLFKEYEFLLLEALKLKTTVKKNIHVLMHGNRFPPASGTSAVMTSPYVRPNILTPNTADSNSADSDAAAPDNGKTDTGRGFLLYNRRPVLSGDILESLKEAEMITGINQGEIRMRLLGQGIGAFNINRGLRELEECAAEIQSLGINAGVIAKDLVKKAQLPAAARHINLTDSSMTFLDGNQDQVFEIKKDTDLLIIITDLSGKAVRQIMTAMAYTGHAIDKQFDEILKKISMAKPAAIFYALNTSSAEGVYVDSDVFSYMGLNDKLAHSKGINFRVMVDEARALSRSCVTDENFGISLLPGASPDWSRGKSSVENDLGKYGRYILTAVDQKLLPFAPEPDAVDNKEFSDSVSGTMSGSSYDAGSNAAKGLKPPPDMDYSRITAFFQTSLPEIIVGLFVMASPFHFLMTGAQSISNHRVFWKTVVGSGFLLAGFLIFCYSLLLLYYRRMIENTPTSKIRSLSMGMVELAGNARLFYDLKTSATKTPCVYYQCRYYKYQRTGDSSHSTLTRSVSSGKLPFYIEDDTGRVLIKPKGAVFNIPLTTQSFRGSYVPSLSLQLHDPNTKVIEKMLPAGTRLYVLGSAHIEKHGRKFTDILADKLRKLKQNPESMAEYDINGDGRIDMDEWEAARGDAERMVYAESLANGAGQSESVVIEKPRFGMLPFIIADSEKKLVRRLMIRTLVFLAGGLIIMGMSVNFLVDFY